MRACHPILSNRPTSISLRFVPSGLLGSVLILPLYPVILAKPRLLSDDGSSYVSGDLAEWLQDKGMKHSRGAPYHPQPQGKIERWHQTLKNRILLENYFLPGDLEAQIKAFVHHYNHQRYHESINNLTPAYVHFSRDKAILKQRRSIKRKTLEARCLHHCQHAA